MAGKFNAILKIEDGTKAVAYHVRGADSVEHAIEELKKDAEDFEKHDNAHACHKQL